MYIKEILTGNLNRNTCVYYDTELDQENWSKRPNSMEGSDIEHMNLSGVREEEDIDEMNKKKSACR